MKAGQILPWVILGLVIVLAWTTVGGSGYATTPVAPPVVVAPMATAAPVTTMMPVAQPVTTLAAASNPVTTMVSPAPVARVPTTMVAQSANLTPPPPGASAPVPVPAVTSPVTSTPLSTAPTVPEHMRHRYRR